MGFKREKGIGAELGGGSCGGKRRAIEQWKARLIEKVWNERFLVG